MINKKYTVCRDNIYVGKVVKTRCVFHLDYNDRETNTEKGKLALQSWKNYRSMLFVVNEYGYANDLLYNSPNYPILNITEDNACTNFERSIILLKDAYNLAALLKYFEYPEELTYEDVKRIRKDFFSSDFAMDNCELFGMKEIYPGEWTYYRDGVEITDPKKIKKYIAKEKIKRLKGERSFVSVGNGVLPVEYWDILNELGNNSFNDLLNGYCNKMNTFMPYKNEVKVKTLTRF